MKFTIAGEPAAPNTTKILYPIGFGIKMVILTNAHGLVTVHNVTAVAINREEKVVKAFSNFHKKALEVDMAGIAHLDLRPDDREHMLVIHNVGLQ